MLPFNRLTSPTPFSLRHRRPPNLAFKSARSRIETLTAMISISESSPIYSKFIVRG
jgi:hypothetical protein